MPRDKTGVKGLIKGIVISLDEVGLEKLELLRERFPVDRKSFVEYVTERNLIYAEHGFKKRRETWNLRLLQSVSQCLQRMKFKEIFDLFKYEMALNHNIVTDEGDALVADQMADVPARTKVDNTNGYIGVGTGWTGVSPKTNTDVNTPTGSREIMDATYPKVKGAFGAADDNVTQYRATFEAGDLNASGIDEASLMNAAAAGDCLAYGEITPSVNVALTDTLQVDWELTFLGA